MDIVIVWTIFSLMSNFAVFYLEESLVYVSSSISTDRTFLHCYHVLFVFIFFLASPSAYNVSFD